MSAPRIGNEELRALREREYQESAHAVRSRGFTVVFALALVVLALAPALPGVGAFAGFGVAIAAPVFFGMLALHLVLVWLERRASAHYVLVDALETVFHVAAYGLLIVSSRRALAIPWFFLSINAQIVPLHPWPWVPRAAYVLMPVVVAACFERMGQRHDALVSLVLGVALLLILRVSTLAFEERIKARAKIAELERNLERARIARELHDGIGADLTAVILKARTAAEGTSGAEHEVLAALANRTRTALAELRSIVWAVHEPAICLAELVEQLRARATELVPSSLRCMIHADLDGARVVPGEFAVLTLRVVQESVSNAARHAGASAVAVRLRWDERFVVEIGDDGRFRANDNPGFGLTNLRHRVEQAGGTFALEVSSSGTVVRADLPLPP